MTSDNRNLRRIAGLLAGWLACVFLVATADGLVRSAPIPLPAKWISALDVFLAALVGGYVSALIAKDRMIPRILAALVLFTGLAYGASPVASPGSSAVLLALLGGLGVYLGAWLKDG